MWDKWSSMPVKLGTGTVRFKCGLVMFTNVFCFFSYIYLMHWSDSHRHLCCLDTQYVMDARKLFLYYYMSSQMFLLIPAAFFKRIFQSLAFTNILFFKSSCSHQIQFLMARHPFKNPLKALVTFQATCFCVFVIIHLIQKKPIKHQQL